MTERVRQFHFAMVVAGILLVARSAAADLEHRAFTATRSGDGCTIQSSFSIYDGSCFFTSITGCDGSEDDGCLLVDDPVWYDTDTESVEVDPEISRCNCTGKFDLPFPCEWLEFRHLCEGHDTCGGVEYGYLCGTLDNPFAVAGGRSHVCSHGEPGDAVELEPEVSGCGCRTVAGGPAEVMLAAAFLGVFLLSLLVARRQQG